MANTYTQIYIQLILAVSGRINVIPGDIKPHLRRSFIQGSGIFYKHVIPNGTPDVIFDFLLQTFHT